MRNWSRCRAQPVHGQGGWHPDLQPAEVYAALAYFHDRHDSIVAAIEAGKALAERSREMKVSRGTIIRAYDFANRAEAAAAARKGRKPKRPPYKWSDESRDSKSKPRNA